MKRVRTLKAGAIHRNSRTQLARIDPRGSTLLKWNSLRRRGGRTSKGVARATAWAANCLLQGAGRGERRQLSAKALDLQSKSKGETAAKSRDKSGLQSNAKQRGTHQRGAYRQGKEGANAARKRKERLNADSINTKMASSGKLRQDVMANKQKRNDPRFSCEWLAHSRFYGQTILVASRHER
jgi:hypothetical protein